MTIGGVNMTVALGVLAAIGDVSRFSSSEKLVSYFGLNPKVRQSGDHPAYHGRISKEGARMLERYLSKPLGPSQGNPAHFAPSSRG